MRRTRRAAQVQSKPSRSTDSSMAPQYCSCRSGRLRTRYSAAADGSTGFQIPSPDSEEAAGADRVDRAAWTARRGRICTALKASRSRTGMSRMKERCWGSMGWGSCAPAKQSDSTSAMVHNGYDQIAHLSTAVTLHPGDLAATGTPSGVGF